MKKSFFAMDGPYATVMNFIWNLIVISVLWVICCIPVVTIGASTTAAYFAAAKVMRAGEGKAAAEFFRSFRLNIKYATVLTVIYALVLTVLLFECVYIYNSSQFPLAILYLFYGTVLLTVASSLYLFVFLSRFSLKKFQLFRMAVLSTFRSLISTILLLALLAAMGIGVYLMPWGLLLFPGGMFYLMSYLMEPVMRKHMSEPELGVEDKWYYFNKK